MLGVRASDSLADPYGSSAAIADDIRKWFIRLGFLRIVFHCMIQVFQLLVPYSFQCVDQFSEFVVDDFSTTVHVSEPFEQHSHLIVVVVAYFCLDGLCTRHCGFTPHDPSRPA